jgi:hypothetical protein
VSAGRHAGAGSNTPAFFSGERTMTGSKSDAEALGGSKMLAAWWGIPLGEGAQCVDGPMRRFQLFGYGLQKACADEYLRQMQEAFVAHLRLLSLLQELLRCQLPQDVIVLELNTWHEALQKLPEQTKAWSDLAGKWQACFATLLVAKAAQARIEECANDD